MILPNEAAHDYRYCLKVDSAIAILGPAPLVADLSVAMRGTWGNPFGDTTLGDPTDHGWEVLFTNLLDSGVYSHTITLRIPNLSHFTHTYTGVGWLTSLDDVKLVFTNLQLVTDCSAWTVTFDGFELLINGASEYSDSTPRTISGTDYDPNDDTTYSFGQASPDLLGEPLPDCLTCPIGPPFPTFTETKCHITADVDWGWEYKQDDISWYQEPIDIDADWPVPEQACSCEVGLEVPAEDSPPTCRHIFYSVEGLSHSERSFYADLHCYCDGSPILSFPVYLYQNTYRQKLVRSWADPMVATNRLTQEDSGSECWASGGEPGYDTSTSGPTARTHGMARWYSSVINVVNNAYCSLYEGSVPICPPPIHEGDPDPVLTCDEVPDCHGCADKAYSGLSWLTTPCGDDCIGDYHLTSGSPQDAILYATCCEVGVRVMVRRTNFLTLNDLFLVHAGNVGSAQSAWHPSGALGCFYDEDGETYVQWSRDKAETWDVAVDIAPGANPAPAVDPKNGIAYVALHLAGDWELWRQLSVDADWEFVSTIMTAANGRTGLELHPGGEDYLVFWINDGGTIKKALSTNMGETWTLT